jgi:hypothetical protein
MKQITRDDTDHLTVKELKALKKYLKARQTIAQRNGWNCGPTIALSLEAIEICRDRQRLLGLSPNERLVQRRAI